jgi:hypothetical protein
MRQEGEAVVEEVVEEEELEVGEVEVEELEEVEVEVVPQRLSCPACGRCTWRCVKA